jgi:hypothetical protein
VTLFIATQGKRGKNKVLSPIFRMEDFKQCVQLCFLFHLRLVKNKVSNILVLHDHSLFVLFVNILKKRSENRTYEIWLCKFYATHTTVLRNTHYSFTSIWTTDLQSTMPPLMLSLQCEEISFEYSQIPCAIFGHIALLLCHYHTHLLIYSKYHWSEMCFAH